MKKVWTVKYTVYLRESGIEKKATIGKRFKNNFIAQEKSYFLRSESLLFRTPGRDKNDYKTTVASYHRFEINLLVQSQDPSRWGKHFSSLSVPKNNLNDSR